MMIERHYDEEALIALAETARADSDAHLVSCTDCTDKLESFRMIAEALQDRDVWDAREVRVEAVPATVATLRAFAERMSDEDSAAETLLTELLAGARETWLPRLHEHPEWRTAGVVRKLIDAASRAIDTMPPDAVEMTAVATEIAEGLDPAAFPTDTVSRLRGAAWRERAYSLYYTGRYLEAEEAVHNSTRCFGTCTLAEYELARVQIVEVLVERALERVDTALNVATSSVDTFLLHGDLTRTASAALARAHLLFKSRRFDEAFDTLLPLEQKLRGSEDAETHARVLANLGYTVWKVGRYDEAIAYYESAAALFDYLEITTEAARIRWTVASMLAEESRYDEAHRRFDVLLPQFEKLGMTNEAALIRMDIAEILLLSGLQARVEALCVTAMNAFSASGAAHTTRALTALAYIKEAARTKAATPALVRHVRDYIRKLPQDRELLFAPPPA